MYLQEHVGAYFCIFVRAWLRGVQLDYMYIVRAYLYVCGLHAFRATELRPPPHSTRHAVE